MTQFECKVSDLMKENTNVNTNVPVEKPNNKIDEYKKPSLETENSTSRNLFEILDNINNIKAFIVTLLVYLIIHSELFVNVIINTFDFLNSSGRLSLIGNVILFSITLLTFSYLS